MKVSWPCTCIKVLWPDPPRGGSRGGKIGHGGSPSSRRFFFRPEGYRDEPNGWQWSRLFRQIRPGVEPRRRKNGSMRGLFSKGLLLQIGMQQQQTECILISWIEISWLFAVRTDFTNLTVMLSDLLRNLTFDRSAHCTQVSDQCPLGLLLSPVTTHIVIRRNHSHLKPMGAKSFTSVSSWVGAFCYRSRVS